jgi:hypothetical protein
MNWSSNAQNKSAKAEPKVTVNISLDTKKGLEGNHLPTLSLVQPIGRSHYGVSDALTKKATHQRSSSLQGKEILDAA